MFFTYWKVNGFLCETRKWRNETNYECAIFFFFNVLTDILRFLFYFVLIDFDDITSSIKTYFFFMIFYNESESVKTDIWTERFKWQLEIYDDESGVKHGMCSELGRPKSSCSAEKSPP